MSKRYIYRPNRSFDDSYVVAEFVKNMPLLEQAHKCPVRLVKTKGIIERYAVYELIQTKGGDNERTCKGIGKNCGSMSFAGTDRNADADTTTD